MEKNNHIKNGTFDIGKKNTYQNIKLEGLSKQDFDDSYKIIVNYKYYNSSKYIEEETGEIIQEAVLNEIENDISLGNLRWSIENQEIKLEFKDSYNINNIKQIHCSIFDVDYAPLQSFTRQLEGIIEVENTEGFNKLITIKPEEEFEIEKSYRIAISFRDENGKEIARYEPDNLITNY